LRSEGVRAPTEYHFLMSDEKTPRQKLEDDGSTCPFCGTEHFEACVHLLASFSTDLSDGDGGVLGEGWVESVVREPAREFGRACRDLLQAVWEGNSQEQIDARQARLRKLTKGDGAAGWWGWVVEEIAGNDSCSDDDVGLGYFATDPVAQMVREVPQVLVGDAVLGGMTSTLVCFLWSDDQEAAIDALEARIGEATEAVRGVTAAISAIG
jgi:hypothetical protein